jgi:hypothetical protein
MSEQTESLRVGWAKTDLTPDQPVVLAGQFHARVSEGVRDPITATALALESVRGGQTASQAVLVSVDIVAIPEGLREAVREKVRAALPDLDVSLLFLNATHTHTAPDARNPQQNARDLAMSPPRDKDLKLEAMTPAEVEAHFSTKIAAAVVEAWQSREPAAMGYGLGQAVVGHNRRVTYYDGHSVMYGKTNDLEFSHVEGYEDHTVNVLGFWNSEKRLTGLVVNVPCPSQVSESEWMVSADYWHETREELKKRLGPDLYVLPQASAAGDQSPHLLVNQQAEERMRRLAGRSEREEIGVRIADAVMSILPCMEQELDPAPLMIHRAEMVELPRRLFTKEEVAAAEIEADKARRDYEALREDLLAHPEKRQEPRWYQEITARHSSMVWWGRVKERYEQQATEPTIPHEIHLLRLGEVAIATNPFEYYLDFGVQIKARSKAVQTFVVQLVGNGTYLPTQRAVQSGSYGAIGPSTAIGPEGGRALVDWTVAAIEEMFETAG